MTTDRTLAAAAALLIGLAQGVAAQQTAEACLQTRDIVGAYLGVPANATSAPIVIDDWCALGDIALGSGEPYSTAIGIDSLRWQTEGLFAIGEGTLFLPSAVTMKAEGLRVGVTIGDPVMDYLMAAQRQPQVIDIDLTIKYDHDRGVLTLDDLSVDFPGDNDIRMRAQVANIDATSLNALESSMFGASLNDLSLRVETNGLFETYALMPLGQFFLGATSDPAATVAEIQKAAQGMIADLPDAILAAPDKAAMSAFVADLPNPSGRLHLTIAADQGIGMTRLAPIVMTGVGSAVENLDTMLAGVTLTFDYRP